LVKALSTIPDNTSLSAPPRATRWTRLRVHLRVFAIAIAFGLGAYVVVQGLIAMTRHLGWLDWLYS
jgi:TRAP-type C4-dicarboxylate transport system permease small subunit